MYNKNDFYIPAFTTGELPTVKCRAVICGVSIKPNDDDKDFGFIKIQFLLLSPELSNVSIYEKTYVDWSIYGGIEAAFHCLINDDEVDGFENLIGTVFDAQVYYRAYDSKIIGELELVRVVALPDYDFEIED